jgi:hypothetical protein
MNHLSFKLLVLTTALACTVSTSMAQQSKKEAIKHAESIDFIRIEAQPDKFCYIVPHDGFIIYTIDGIARDINYLKHPLVLAAGRHHFTGQWFGASGQMRWKSVLLSLRHEFEEGKCYKIGFSRNFNDIYYEEITADTLLLRQAQEEMTAYKVNIDAQREKVNEYLAFQEANPTRLEGTWSGKGKRALSTPLIKYAFTGNKMTYEGKNKQKMFVAEGRLFYNENTIVLIPGKAYANGEELEKFGKQPNYVWYYTITNDALELEGGRPFVKGLSRWENNGEFRKIILQ